MNDAPHHDAFIAAARQWAAACRDSESTYNAADVGACLTQVTAIVTQETKSLALNVGDLWDGDVVNIANAAVTHARATAIDLAALTGMCTHLPTNDADPSTTA